MLERMSESEASYHQGLSTSSNEGSVGSALSEGEDEEDQESAPTSRRSSSVSSHGSTVRSKTPESTTTEEGPNIINQDRSPLCNYADMCELEMCGELAGLDSVGLGLTGTQIEREVFHAFLSFVTSRMLPISWQGVMVFPQPPNRHHLKLTTIPNRMCQCGNYNDYSSFPEYFIHNIVCPAHLPRNLMDLGPWLYLKEPVQGLCKFLGDPKIANVIHALHARFGDVLDYQRNSMVLICCSLEHFCLVVRVHVIMGDVVHVDERHFWFCDLYHLTVEDCVNEFLGWITTLSNSGQIHSAGQNGHSTE